MTSALNEVLDDEPTQEELSFFELAQQPKETEKKKPKKEYEPTPEELEFFELESPYQQEPMQEDVGYWKSILNSVPRGLIEGTIRLGRTMGPLPDVSEEQKYDPDKIAAQLDEWFPTEDETISNVIKKTGQVLPTALSSPPIGAATQTPLSMGTRAVAGGAASEGAKALGLPQWAQDIAEIAPWLAPDLKAVNVENISVGGMLSKLQQKSPGWAKKLASKYGPESLKKSFQELIDSAASRKEVLSFAKAAGMKEAEITPLLQGETKQRWLAKTAKKGEAMERKLLETKGAIGRVYDSIGELPGADIKYSASQANRLKKGIQDQFKKMPASVKNVIQEDYQALIDGPIDGKKLMKFYSDVNHELGPKTKQLALLKDPIKKSLMEVDSAMGHMFEATNKLKSKYHTIANRLKPGIADELVSEAKSQGALWGVLSGNVGLLQKIAGVTQVKKVAEFMLTSPRWQNLSGKMVNALNNGKFVAAEHIKKQMIDEMNDIDPRVAQALEELNIQETLD